MHILPTERSNDTRTSEEKAELLTWVSLSFHFHIFRRKPCSRPLPLSSGWPLCCSQPLQGAEACAGLTDTPACMSHVGRVLFGQPFFCGWARHPSRTGQADTDPYQQRVGGHAHLCPDAGSTGHCTVWARPLRRRFRVKLSMNSS